MSGFDNDVVYAKNADFTAADNQNVSENNGLITDGQLWIGSTATNAGGTHINVGQLISSDSSVTIAYDSPNIDLTVSGTPVDFTLTGNSGVATSVSSNVNVITTNTTGVFTGSGDDLNFDYPSTNLGIGTSFPVLTSGFNNIVLGKNGSGASITSGTRNTILGGASALSLDTGTLNTFIGSNVGTDATVATSNIAIGSNSLASFVGTTAGIADGNTCIGVSSLNALLTGRFNAAFGITAGQLYNSNESSNIVIMNRGTFGESNTLRIGEQGSGDRQVNRCFIAGITGVSVSNSKQVYIDTTTGQLGSIALDNQSDTIAIRSTLIDMTQTGITTLFTPEANFIVTGFTAYAQTITGTAGSPVANFGWTNPLYNDTLTGYTTFSPTQGNYNNFALSGSNVPVVPASTPFVINVTTADVVATANIQRIDILGYYLN